VSFVGVFLYSASAAAAPAHVTLSAPAPGTELRIQGAGIEEPTGKACSTPCTVDLRPGPYTIYFDSGGGRPSSVVVHVEGSGAIEVRPLSRSRRTLGLILIGTGGLLFTAGVVVLEYDFLRKLSNIESMEGGPIYHSPGWIKPLEIAGAVGLVTSLFGIGLLVSASPTAIVRSPQEMARDERAPVKRTEIVFVAPAAVARGGGGGVGGGVF
jgi:hypothetical protein